MKQVVLVRHAEAVSKNKGIPDFERSLVQRGVKDARLTGKRLVKRGVKTDLLISSPANRAIETAHAVAEVIGYPIERILIEPNLYESSEPAALLEVLRRAGSEVESSVMVFGHDPQFTASAAMLVNGFEQTLPKGSALGAEFDVEMWPELAPGGGRVTFFEVPMSREAKAQLFEEARNALIQRLVTHMQAELADIDAEAAAKLKGATTKAAAKLADRFTEKIRKRDFILQHRLRFQSAVEEETTSPEPVEEKP